MKLTTTFEQLHKAGACDDGHRKLAKYLGGVTKYGKTKPINIITILDSNGLDDCLWVIDITANRKTRIYIGAKFAESILPILEEKYPNSRGPRDCINACFDFCNGKIGQRELDAARSAVKRITAKSAATAAAGSVGCAAWSAVDSAAAKAAELRKQEKIIREFFN